MAENKQFDFSAFTLPLAQLGPHQPKLGIPARLANKLSLGLIMALAFVPFGTLMIVGTAIGVDNDSGLKFYIPAVVNLFIFVHLMMIWKHSQTIIAKARMHYFADSNSFTFVDQKADPPLNGMPFNNGTHRKAYSIVEGAITSTQFEVGNFVFNKDKRSEEVYGYARLELPRHLPHMVLDSKKDNYLGVTSMADDISGSQKLALEGNFNDYFTLFCPNEYERDALYIFTPDLMALLIDHGSKFDIEVVDNQLYLYKYGGFDFTKPGHIKLIFRAFQMIGTRMQARSSRYTDARVAGRHIDIVAPEGRRLKRGYVSILLTILFVLIYLIVQFMGGDLGS